MKLINLLNCGLFLTLVFCSSFASAQDTTDVRSDSAAVITSKSAEVEVGEIELMEITIEAVIEKPRVSILPKRLDPQLGEMEFIDRSFEKELKKGPGEPFLVKGEARKPFKIEQQALKTISDKKE